MTVVDRRATAMEHVSLAHTSHPFWSKLLSISGLLEPNAVSYVVAQPSCSRATSTTASRKRRDIYCAQRKRVTASSEPQSLPIGDQSQTAARMHRENSLGRGSYNRIIPSRRAEPGSNDAVVRAESRVSNPEPLQRVDFKRAGIERRWVQQEKGSVQVKKSTPTKTKAHKAIDKCKKWASSRKSRAIDPPRNRDSQQYVAEWVQEVHGAIDDHSEKVVASKKKTLRQRLMKRVCMKTGRKRDGKKGKS